MQDDVIGAVADGTQKAAVVRRRRVQQGESLIGMGGQDHGVEVFCRCIRGFQPDAMLLTTDARDR
jgi:hypothetical protein